MGILCNHNDVFEAGVRPMAPSTTECSAILSALVTNFEHRLREICNACDYYNHLGMFQVSYLMLVIRKFDHIVQV